MGTILDFRKCILECTGGCKMGIWSETSRGWEGAVRSYSQGGAKGNWELAAVGSYKKSFPTIWKRRGWLKFWDVQPIENLGFHQKSGNYKRRNWDLIIRIGGFESCSLDNYAWRLFFWFRIGSMFWKVFFHSRGMGFAWISHYKIHDKHHFTTKLTTTIYSPIIIIIV